MVLSLPRPRATSLPDSPPQAHRSAPPSPPSARRSHPCPPIKDVGEKTWIKSRETHGGSDSPTIAAIAISNDFDDGELVKNDLGKSMKKARNSV